MKISSCRETEGLGPVWEKMEVATSFYDKNYVGQTKLKPTRVYVRERFYTNGPGSRNIKTVPALEGPTSCNNNRLSVDVTLKPAFGEPKRTPEVPIRKSIEGEREAEGCCVRQKTPCSLASPW